MSPPSTDYDALVLGAGAAGLAAAIELAARGRRVCVLEARDRVGGRILTRREPGLDAPIELGAEFIHGRLETTFAWLERCGLDAAEATQSQWVLRDGELVTGRSRFEELKRALARAARPAEDIPVAAFLEGAGRDVLPADLAAFVRMLVEGFDAADPAIASTWELLDEWGVEGLGNTPSSRPVDGYGALVDALARLLDPGRATLLLATPVHTVRWRPGRVTAEATRGGEPVSVSAPRAVVTLPLGVLKLADEDAGAVRFEPALAAKRPALARIAAGPAIKLVLRFRAAFRETLEQARYRDGAFFHAPGHVFPTFWTALPKHAPLLNAWSGGPNADRLAGLTPDALARRALEGVDALFGAQAHAADLVEHVYVHDWQADPYAVGAYSYVAAGGQPARAELAAPLEQTLFFAGEATEHEVEAATVDGALRSGTRAAREALGP